MSEKMAKDVLSNPSRALDLTAKIATSAVSKKSKQALSTIPELKTFYNTGKCLYLGKFVYIMVYIWTKNIVDYTQAHHWERLI